MTKPKNIGVNVPIPKETCEDKNCPFHGTLGVRGRSFVGTVIKLTFQKNVLVEWSGRSYLPKYERYEKKRTRVWAHAPLCLGITQGDKVKIMETRKISKTKNFVVIEKL